MAAPAGDVPVLWHLRVSHYNEKARWALDFKGIPHVRREPPPGLHPAYALALTRRSITLPVLKIDGVAIADSSRIIEELERRFPEPPLYPSDPSDRERALRLEEELDVSLGPDVRRFIFQHLFADPDLAIRHLTVDARGSSAKVLRRIRPVIQPVVSRRYQVSADGAVRAEANIWDNLDRIERELGDSGYLVAGRFTVADLTAAALLAPLLKPPQFAYPGPAFPVELDTIRQRALAHPAGAWAMDVYARHRGTSAAVAG